MDSLQDLSGEPGHFGLHPAAEGEQAAETTASIEALVVVMVELAHVVGPLLDHPVDLENNGEVLVGISCVSHLEVPVEVFELHLALGVQELIFSHELDEDHVGVGVDPAHDSTLILGERWIQGFIRSVSDHLFLPGLDPSVGPSVYPCLIVVANSVEFK